VRVRELYLKVLHNGGQGDSTDAEVEAEEEEDVVAAVAEGAAAAAASAAFVGPGGDFQGMITFFFLKV